MKRKVIALTGYIGSGKSTVASILRQWGYKTVDCDAIAREISEQSDTVEKVAQLLGKEYAPNGKLDRVAIREKVFSDAQLLIRYQSLFFDGVKARLQSIAEQTDDTLFVEISVFYAFDFAWDEVWLVQCNAELSVTRVTARDGVSEQSVQNTLARQQLPPPDRIIFNDGNVQQLQNALKIALQQANL